MSTTIDQRVVEMQFNNKQFESNVKTSISTLDKLKQSLNLTGASKGLENVGTAAKNVNMSGLSSAVETVRMKFSALEVMAVTALANITNSAINAGKRFVSALTTEPISEGFSEYELKMGSIQTIMASTGESLETVNKYLNELNVYADKTIYSFADMTSNIGKFTNAGVSLKDAVAAIQGISNVAAVSGANTNEASRAMYNFAQALSAGYVKLIDWKSIENANMATVEFKNQLIETAVAAGTVTKTADGMYKTLKGNVFNATMNFNDVLQDQWMTTEVLVETLGKYADETTDIGKKAFAAAQDIKTISQLFDTLKEAAGSGWAQTWEIIIGDFEEAKTLLTKVGGVIGGFIDRTSDARNELLRFWKENGGRDDLIEALKNSFEALGKIIKPIQEAFRYIFPPTTGKQLVALTNGLKKFTEKLKIGDETSDKIRRTFAGLFAVLDMVKDAFLFVFKVAGKVFGLFGGPTAGGILELTARFGDFLVKLRDTAKEGDIFGKAFEKIKTIFTTVADKIKDAIDRIGLAFEGFKSIDLGPLRIFSEDVETQFKPFTFIGEVISTTFEIIKDVLTKAAPYFEAFKESVSGTFEKLGFESFADVLQSLVDGGAMVLLITLINGIKTALEALLDSGVVKKVDGFVDSTKNILDEVGDSLQAFQNKLKSEALLNIAMAIGVLAAALWVLSNIPEEKLMTALQGISILFIEIGALMSAVSKMNPGAGAVKMMAMSSQMKAMALAILILSVALKSLAELEWEEMMRGVSGVAALSLILVKTSEALGKASGKMVSGGMGLIFFATGLLILVQSVKQLSSLSWKELAKGLGGVGGLLLELAMFTKLMGDGKGMMKIGFALIPLATGLLILSQSVKSLAGLSWEELLKGLGGVGGLLLELAMFTKLMGDGKGMMKIGLAMVPLAVGMFILAQAVKQLSGLSWGEMLKGLTGIAGILVILAGVSKIVSPGNLLAMGVALVGVGVALNLIAASMLIIGSMSWEDMIKSMVGLGGALLILAGAMALMSGGLAGAVALTAMALALALLVPSLVVLGMMDLNNIGRMLLALAGVFAVFAIAGLALGPLTPVLLSLAGAIALLGVGVLALGAGLTLATAAMAAFVAGGAAFSIALVSLIKNLIKLIPFAVEQLGKALVVLLDSLILAMPLIFKTLGLFLEGLIKLIIEYTPPIMKAVGVILSELIKLLLEYVPKIAELVVTLLINILNLLAEHVDDIVVAALNLIVGFVDGLIEGIPKVVEAIVRLLDVLVEEIGEFIPELIEMGFDLMIKFMDSMAEKLEEKIPELIDSAKLMIEKVVDGIVYALETGIPWIKEQITKVAKAMWTAFKEFFGINSPSKLFYDGAEFIISGLVDGLLNGIESVKNAIKNVAESIWSKFKEFFGINSPSTLMMDGAGFIISGLVDGLGNGILNVGNKALEVGSEIFSKIKDGIGDISEVAGNVVDGLSTGIQNGVSKIGDAAKKLGSSIVGGLKSVLNINSPSKVAEDIAEFTGEGLIIGLNNMSLATEKAAEGLGDSAIDGMTKSLTKIGDCIDEDMDLTPTIRPVVDMSEVDKNLSDTFSQQRFLDVSSTLSKASSMASDIKSRMDAKADADGSIINEGNTNSVVINQYNTVRSNDDIDKINSGLTRLINKNSRAKGVIPL
jgi:tape measure domain-containing protein